MRRFDIIILIVLMVLSAVNSFGAILSNSNSEQKEFFAKCYPTAGPSCAVPVDYYQQQLIREVEQDLEMESMMAGLPTSSYLSTDASFKRLLGAMLSQEFRSMDRADLIISVIKLSMRYAKIRNASPRAPGFSENEQEFLSQVRELCSRHNLPFQF